MIYVTKLHKKIKRAVNKFYGVFSNAELARTIRKRRAETFYQMNLLVKLGILIRAGTKYVRRICLRSKGILMSAIKYIFHAIDTAKQKIMGVWKQFTPRTMMQQLTDQLRS